MITNVINCKIKTKSLPIINGIFTLIPLLVVGVVMVLSRDSKRKFFAMFHKNTQNKINYTNTTQIKCKLKRRGYNKTDGHI